MDHCIKRIDKWLVVFNKEQGFVPRIWLFSASSGICTELHMWHILCMYMSIYVGACIMEVDCLCDAHKGNMKQ